MNGKSFPLAATLTLPARYPNEGRLPVVVMVHGSTRWLTDWNTSYSGNAINE